MKNVCLSVVAVIISLQSYPIGAQWIGDVSSGHKHAFKAPCTGIQENGKWIDDVWTPFNCAYYNWSAAQAKRCVANATVAFIGGAFTRQLYRCVTDTFSKGKSRKKYEGDDELSCLNYIAAQHRDYEYVGPASRQEGSPNYRLLFYWQPLLSWNPSWCHIQTCTDAPNQEPKDAVCKCPPRSKIDLSYTGLRIRDKFLKDLLETTHIDYVVTAPDVGDVTATFMDTLTLVPSIVLSYNKRHPIHQQLHSNFTGVIDFTAAIDARRDSLVNGHLDLVLSHLVANQMLTHAARTLCPWERYFLH